MMKTKDLTLGAIFIALISIGSKIAIPLDMLGMRFTLQWLFVLLCALIMEKKSILVLLVYLLIGLIGLPVFARGGGIWYVMKPTFGFLLGFLISVIVMSYLKIDEFRKTLAGLIVYYLTGFVYYVFMMNVILHNSIGLWLSIINCFTTVIPDFVLCLIAVFIYKRIRYVLK
ncbi:MAG: biotin transporter BioY [Erysipelotrichaceae bacterium]